MSAPRYLRMAIESCRPVKSSALKLRPALIPHRTYASRSRDNGPVDITEGFPIIPESGQTAEENMPEERQSYKEIQQSAPKQTPSAIARPTPAASETPAQHSNNTTRKSMADVRLNEKAETASSSSLASTSETSTNIETEKSTSSSTPQRPIPPNVLAAYHTPLKHPSPYGVPVASLQLRSYSVRNLEFFADFALRAAFYLNLPASGPVPLPKIIQRWTMPRSNFVHKKSQENFERITRRRLITIKDGDTSVVEVWLAFLRKWQFYGVGMKANVWQWESLDVANKLDAQFASPEIEKELDEKMANFGFNRSVSRNRSLQQMMDRQGMNHVGSPMTHLRRASQATAEQ